MLDQLSKSRGSTQAKKRVGRGPGSGKGKTCGTGVKGQGTRSGKKIKAWFEGGQMPLQQRVPKRGFHNRFRTDVEIVNLSDLAKLGDGAT
ncbi:MAG: 50S ribosomal protein L15, partial [bacterium]|nr:50S ribosomal protein L15 [bacterium]